MKKILVIEDDIIFQNLFSIALEANFIVEFSKDLREGHHTILQRNYDLFIIDLSLPDGSGLNLCSFIRTQQQTKDKPVIIVSGKTEIDAKVQGFDFGADDYITKPFHPKELLARVTARLKHSGESGDPGEARFLYFDNIKMDFTQLRLVDHSGVYVELTQVEFKLLAYFIKNSSLVLSRNQILESVWTDNLAITERVVDTHISHLRRKIEKFGIKIKAVHGVGYCLNSSRSL